MGQNSSHESSTTIPSHESVTVRQEKQERPDLIPTPLRIESLEIGDSDATGVQVIVPTHVAPLPSQIHSVRRFGMIREGDGQEGREEIELQTTTVTTAGEVTVSKEESERTSGTESVTDEVKTTRTEPTAPLISSTEAETPSSTLPPVTATTSEPGIAAFLVRLHESRTSRERHSNSGPAATVPSTMLTMKVVTVTEGTTLGQERSTSPSPVYIPSSPQKAKQVAFLFDDEFVRYLNRHYYSGSVFNSVVSRDLH